MRHAKRTFINRKYQLDLPLSTRVQAKYSPASVNSASCLDEDFEILPLGPLALSSPGWTVTQAGNSSANPILCPTMLYTFAPPNINMNAIVMATPVTDTNCGNVGPSPFGGNHVLQLNRNNQNTNLMCRITKTFSVSSSNWFYKYAYKSVLQPAHNCCNDATVMFRFYDCAGNYLSTISSTLMANMLGCPSTPPVSCGAFPAPVWATGWNGVVYTPDWVVTGVNLSQYIGSCITVEVLASQCSATGHMGYIYYDAQCSDNGFLVNGKVPASQNYTVCAATATLSGPPCFNLYSWQGPAGSGVSGSTASAVVTSVPGTYTLTLGSGPNALMQTISLVFSASQGVSISGPSLLSCPGQTAVFNATGAGMVSFEWGDGQTSSSVVFTPSASTVITLTATDNQGCKWQDTKTLTVMPAPTVNISGGAICLGNSFVIRPSGADSYTIEGGSASVSPTTTTSYSVIGSSAGCSSRPVMITVTVFPLPALTVANGTICTGDSFTIRPAGALTYTFSSGSPIVSPLQSSFYTVTGTDQKGCRSEPVTVEVKVFSIDKASFPSKPIQCLRGNRFSFALDRDFPGETEFLWSFGASASPSVSTLANPENISFTQAGRFDVRITVVYKACKDSFTNQVLVADPFPLSSDWDTTIVIGQKVKLNAFAGAGYTYTWSSESYYLDCSLCRVPDPVSSTTTDITYTVSVEDSLHCRVSQTTYRIFIERLASIDVPSAFTPNGDGINDLIFASGWGLRKLNYFRVYNRWGQLVFETNNLEEGWNGKFNGVPQNPDTYVYQVSAESYLEGQAPLIKSGTFNLIR